MKISLMVDDKLMVQAMVALDAATYADAINLALQRVVRKHDYQRIFALRGTLDWTGDSAGKNRSLDDLVGALAPAKTTITTEELCAPVDEKTTK